MDFITSTLVGLAVMWPLSAGVILLVIRGERRQPASIGWHRPTRALILQGFSIGVVLSLAVPLLSVVVGSILPTEANGTIAEVTQKVPWWVMLLSVMTAGMTEEVLFRGYALERLFEWSGSKWLSSLVALSFFVLVHAGGWNVPHLFGVVLPLGAILTGLYWWRRSLVLVMIVHLTINLPLVFMAMGGS